MIFLFLLETFVLVETFVLENNFNYYENFFSEYKLSWLPANKKFNKGRGIGGALFGIKSCYFGKFINFRNVRTSKVIVISYENVEILVIPVYLNCNYWNDDFYNLCNLIYNMPEARVVLLGDFNARIADLQGLQGDLFIGNVVCARGVLKR